MTSELALLQILATGMSRAYEIGPSFRNEGLHGAAEREYRMLEAYAVDMDFGEMVGFTRHVIRDFAGDSIAHTESRFADVFAQIASFEYTDLTRLTAFCSERLPHLTAAKEEPVRLARRVWDQCLAPQLRGLVTVLDIPGSGSPLIDRRNGNPTRAWFYLNGLEVAEVARNEIDPSVMARRLQDQAGTETQVVNRSYRDFLSSLGMGIPPCVGVGLGVRRLVDAARDAGRSS